jgi:hypothetical protein
MGQNKFTQLNIGTDGNIMDETGITYPDGPPDRRRARVVISGDEIDKLSDVKNTQNTGSEYGLVTRVIAPWQGGLSYEFGFATITNADALTEIVSYTVPVDATYYLTGLNCSADSVGVFKVFVNDGSGDSQVLQFRNNITNLNVIVSNEMPMVQVDSGSVITLYAQNTTTPAMSLYEGTLMGFNQPTV